MLTKFWNSRGPSPILFHSSCTPPEQQPTDETLLVLLALIHKKGDLMPKTGVTWCQSRHPADPVGQLLWPQEGDFCLMYAFQIS